MTTASVQKVQKLPIWAKFCFRLILSLVQACLKLGKAWFKPDQAWLDLARRAVEPTNIEPSRASSPVTSSQIRAELLRAEPPSSRAELELEAYLVSSRAESSRAWARPTPNIHHVKLFLLFVKLSNSNTHQMCIVYVCVTAVTRVFCVIGTHFAI